MTALIWTVASAIGTLTCLWLTTDSFRDIKALNGTSNGRRMIAYAARRRNVVRTGVLMVFTLIGVLALSDLTADYIEHIRVLFIASTVSLTLDAIADARLRHHLLHS